MSNEKYIILRLMNGSVSGPCEAKQHGRSCLAYRISRTELKHCEEYEDLSQRLHAPGVYFMFGHDDESKENKVTGRDFVYIGEGNDVLYRVRKPHQFEDDGNRYWQDVVFVVVDGYFDKGKIEYLEKRFLEIAKKADRYNIANANKLETSKTNISKMDHVTLEDIIEDVRLLLFSLGYRVLEPQPSRTNIAKEDYLFFSRQTRNGNKGEKATGVRKEDGFWVLEGSFIHPFTANYLTPGYKALREQYKSLIKKQTLTKDIKFNSPSAASSFVWGKNSNGLIDWKNKDGISLKYLDDAATTSKKQKTSARKTNIKNTSCCLEMKNKLKRMSPEGHEVLSEQTADNGKEKTHKPPFKFSECGIPVGAKIVFYKDNSVVATVVDDRHIEYKGQTTAMTPLAKKLLDTNKPVQGTAYFTYNGKKLTAIRKMAEKKKN